MKTKSKNIMFWLFFVAFTIYAFYQIGTCPPSRCSLNWIKFMIVSIGLIISVGGIYITRDYKVEEELIEIGEDVEEEKQEKIEEQEEKK